jgi:hypothetical protein
MGSGGAGQWASVEGVGAVVVDDEPEVDDDEHPAARRLMVMSASTIRRVTGRSVRAPGSPHPARPG